MPQPVDERHDGGQSCHHDERDGEGGHDPRKAELARDDRRRSAHERDGGHCEEAEEQEPAEEELPEDLDQEAPTVAEELRAAGKGKPEPEAAPGPEIPSDFKMFVESIEPEREDTHVLLELAELALEGGDAEMALLRYGQALDQDPRSAKAWTGKGTALQQLERYEAALAADDRALERAPEDEIAKRWRETCLRHLPHGGER